MIYSLSIPNNSEFIQAINVGSLLEVSSPKQLWYEFRATNGDLEFWNPGAFILRLQKTFFGVFIFWLASCKHKVRVIFFLDNISSFFY